MTDPATTGYACRDAEVYPVPIERVFDAITDLTTYDDWWTMMRAVPVGGGTRIAPGVTFRFEGGRPGGTPSGWLIEILAVDAPRRIEMSYVEGDLLGLVDWEVTEVDGGTEAAYVYRGVRANAPNSEAMFANYGTRLHSVAMHIDALDGLGRYLAGERLDDEQRAVVRRQVADGIAALDDQGAR